MPIKKAKNISPFCKEVYEATALIPRGKVSTYAAVARFIGRPKAARAVGNALHINPFAPKVPCHRVVKSDGQIGDFAGGVKRKIAILKREGVKCAQGKIVDWPNKRFDLLS